MKREYRKKKKLWIIYSEMKEKKWAREETAATSVWFSYLLHQLAANAKWQISYKSLSSNLFNCVSQKNGQNEGGIHVTMMIQIRRFYLRFAVAQVSFSFVCRLVLHSVLVGFGLAWITAHCRANEIRKHIKNVSNRSNCWGIMKDSLSEWVRENRCAD